jgi:hypothetical protein
LSDHFGNIKVEEIGIEDGLSNARHKRNDIQEILCKNSILEGNDLSLINLFTHVIAINPIEDVQGSINA